MKVKMLIFFVLLQYAFIAQTEALSKESDNNWHGLSLAESSQFVDGGDTRTMAFMINAIVENKYAYPVGSSSGISYFIYMRQRLNTTYGSAYEMVMLHTIKFFDFTKSTDFMVILEYFTGTSYYQIKYRTTSSASNFMMLMTEYDNFADDDLKNGIQVGINFGKKVYGIFVDNVYSSGNVPKVMDAFSSFTTALTFSRCTVGVCAESILPINMDNNVYKVQFHDINMLSIVKYDVTYWRGLNIRQRNSGLTCSDRATHWRDMKSIVLTPLVKPDFSLVNHIKRVNNQDSFLYYKSFSKWNCGDTIKKKVNAVNSMFMVKD